MSKNSDDKPLVKARHDNSVLFSLKDLDSAGTPKSSEDQAKGAAQNDSSGFINLNAIASSSQYVNSGEGQGGMDAAAVVPAMLPMGQKKDNKGVIIAVAVAGVLLVAVIAVLVVVLMREPQQTTIIQQVPASAPAASAPAATAPAAAGGAQADTKEEDKPTEGATADKGEETPPGEEDKAGDKGADKGSRVAAGGGAKAAGGGAAPAEEKQEETPAAAEAPAADNKPKPKPEGGSINDILDDLGGKKAPVADKGGDKGGDTATPPAGGRDLSRNAVKETIGRYQSRVNACGGPGKSGSVLVRFTVQPNGSVGAATVTGDKAGTAEGNCVAAAVRGFKFPEFDGSPKTITFPFSIP